MTLLNKKEILDIAWTEPEDMKLAAFAAKMQLKKVIKEIDALRQRHVGIAFSQELDCWLEAVKKEID